ncbi:MAG: IclR family transcriptional regulator [Hyphomicrobiales bacterium]|nr:IclR family transcriptional regulator [Hyphomicrobiales bacterium]
MSEIAEPSAGLSHHVPVIDRMMEMLFVLEQRPDGATIRDLVESLGVPRTTVYRILNTLERHDVVRRSGEGRYRLGPRLLRLAARSIGDSNGYDLAAIAAPFLKSLSAETGEGSKISVVDGEGLLVVAAASGAREYALTVIPGQRLPLHAGAAGKTLLAHLPKDEVDRRLSRALPRHTSRTLTDPGRLRTELARIRRQGWAQDRGEYAPGIHAFAAPILDRNATIVAALSVPFIAGATADHMERLRVAVVATAKALSGALPRNAA